MSTSPLLRVDDLSVSFRVDNRRLVAVSGASFHVNAGETLAVVGESGSGKSVTALALMRLHPRSAHITGSIVFDGVDLLAAPEKQMRALRGNDIAMIFQDPMTALNPVFSIGDQIVEMIRQHDKVVSKRAAWSRAAQLLALVGVPEPTRRVKQYPHEFSGGMRQRAMIAMAIANGPKLLIADEPTTALDVTIQAQVMEVVEVAQKETGAAVILITHDLGLVAGSADRVLVMYASRIAEHGSLDNIFYSSLNPYTMALLRSVPSLGERTVERLQPIPGNPPSLLDPPPGCAFSPRCDLAIAACSVAVPELVSVGFGHESRCIRTKEIRR